MKGQKGTELLQAAGKNQNLLCNKNQAALFLVHIFAKERTPLPRPAYGSLFVTVSSLSDFNMDFDITSLLASGSKDTKTNGKTTKKVSPLNFFKVNRKFQMYLTDENGYFNNNDVFFFMILFPACCSRSLSCMYYIVFSLIIFFV